MSLSSSYTSGEQAQDLNVIARFLARQDIQQLVPQAPSSAPGAGAAHPTADLLILAGNSLPCTATMAAAALDAGAVGELLITGGIGHATQYLRDAVALMPALQHIATADRPEADIMADMVAASRQGSHSTANTADIDQECSAADCSLADKAQVLLESASTNCGDNAVKSVQLLQQHGRRPGTVVLMQDPTMQARSHASFQKAFADAGWEPKLLSVSPFVPQVQLSPDGSSLQYTDELLPLQPLWPVDRFVSLVMGEVPRLRNGPGGYGPKGRGFIAAVEVPEEVEAAYARLQCVFGTREAV